MIILFFCKIGVCDIDARSKNVEDTNVDFRDILECPHTMDKTSRRGTMIHPEDDPRPLDIHVLI